ncbi:hypothetical protein M2263_003844 [Providencia alcalifaciens]|nr:hypothetical protein [Providencia alcalifaciens]
MSMMKINLSDKIVASIYNVMGCNISSKIAEDFLGKTKNVKNKNIKNNKIPKSIIRALKRKENSSKKTKFPVNINGLLPADTNSLFTTRMNALFSDRLALSEKINLALEGCESKKYKSNKTSNTVFSENLELSEPDSDLLEFVMRHPER